MSRSRARDRGRGKDSGAQWTPAQRALYAWFRSDLGVSIVGSGVATWADQSGNARDVTQGTDPNRPGWSASDALFNGLPALTWAGAQWLDGAAWNIAQPFTVYVVGQAGTFADWKTFLDHNGAGARSIVRADPTHAFATHAGTANVLSANVSGPSLMAAVFNGASSAHYVNSLTAGGTSSPGTNGLGTPRIGAWTAGVYPLQSTSRLCEIVVASGADSAAQREQMFRYLNRRYAIAVAGL